VKVSRATALVVAVGVVTVTSTAPAACAGALTVIWVPAALTVIVDVTGLTPKLTVVAPVNPAPLMLTVVPPRWLPEFGDTLVTTGPNVKTAVVVTLLVPPGPVTVKLTADFAVPAGAVAVSDVLEFTVKLEAGWLPKLTVVAPVKPLPVRVTVVPAVPTFGETAEMTGTG